ncbi:MAG: calcium-binding protein [Alphaproteobacteria bacterium]|nr:calcium-binding protein [Alphaproteobacteria bacterium]
MKNPTLTALIAAATIGAVGLSAAIPAYALGGKDGPRGPRIDFEKVDLNGDGKITPEEMSTYRATKFAEQDADGDGFLSREEISAAILARIQDNMDKRLDRMFKRGDADGDGMISLAELPGGGDRSAKLFERLDKDGDGAISADEMDAMKKRFGKHKKPSDE